jgi:hypothetical protein
MFIYMCSARRIRLRLKSIAFMVCEHEHMNMHPPLPNYAPPHYCVLLQPGLRLITTQNNFEIKRMMSHLVLKLCITTLKVIYCYVYVYCKYKSPLVVPKIPIVRIV